MMVLRLTFTRFASFDRPVVRKSREAKMRVPQAVADALVDPVAYAEVQKVDGALRWLRENAPLSSVEPAGYQPFWAVTRHADILEVEGQNDLFKNETRSSTVISIEPERR